MNNSDQPVVTRARVKEDLLFHRENCTTERIQLVSVKVRVPWPVGFNVKVTIEKERINEKEKA